VVVWVNSGDLFPEIIEYMERVRSRTPHFVELKGGQPEAIKQHGWPVDVLPVDYTEFGGMCTEPKPIKLRSYLECCLENISMPMHRFVTSYGATLVFRGNRVSESHRTPINNGDVIEGIQYVCPIEKWTDEEVLNYLRASGEEMHPRFFMGHSSLDCMSCTAYTGHSLDRMKYIKKHHPIVFHNLKDVFKQIDESINREKIGLGQILSL
jgi:phosphoadenosine phosphosulfate reductase